ncbi:hypothetical protein TUN199_02042 [Pyrenophora tritici-repentis]|nr:hypothetical protein A1F99_118370 [Pyrenophora tritici-repentis]KAI0582727.1 hypothetical protein Alg215_03942 [Pyrenophora tritici-repentis]KAI0584434.1 hypothetical protein Alg130_05210 [Pyrenophora tritici-repentis]KAI0609960.1 hypothetical protein TUN205_05814 [Pyrenophora tritici-repentis]KAI0625954.1 hypothetical protein TUN199_02042 [Pyrenophora tritici-repentis]
MGQQNSSTRSERPITYSVNPLSLKKKLHQLRQLQYLQRFKELQVSNRHIPEINAGAELLILDSLKAIEVVSEFLWPQNSWFISTTSSGCFRNMYLQGHERSKTNISKRALILISKTDETSSPCLTVTLLGQQDRLEFEVRELKDMYSLFRATLDSEYTYEYNCLTKYQGSLSTTYHQMVQQQPQICSKNVPKDRYKLRYLKKERPSDRRTFQGRLITGRLTNFHCLGQVDRFRVGQVDSIAKPFNHLIPSPSASLPIDQLGIFFLQRATMRLPRISSTLSTMVDAAADLLEKEGGSPLATELRKFRISCMSAYDFLSRHPSNRGACDKNDKMIISCVQKVTNTVMVSKHIVGQAQTTWMVSIQHQTKGPYPPDETASDPQDSDSDNRGDNTSLDFLPSPNPENRKRKSRSLVLRWLGLKKPKRG